MTKKLIAAADGIAPSGKVTRIGGKNRYETSYKIAEYFIKRTNAVPVPFGTTAFAHGDDDRFPDALAGGQLCISMPAPIILVKENKTTMPAIIKSYMTGSSGYHPTPKYYTFLGYVGKGKSSCYDALVKSAPF